MNEDNFLVRIDNNSLARLDRSIRVTDKLLSKIIDTDLYILSGHSSDVVSVAFSPDGKTLASGSGDWTIKLWDVNSGKEIKTLAGHTDVVESVAFSFDGKNLASGSIDKTIKLWKLEGIGSSK